MLVRMTEDYLGKGGSSSRIVDDLFDDTFDVSMGFRVIQRPVLGRSLSVLAVRLEN